MFSARDYYAAANRCAAEAIKFARLGWSAAAEHRRTTAKLYRQLAAEAAK